MRIELTTSSLPRKCSTTELQRLLTESLRSVGHIGQTTYRSSYLTHLTDMTLAWSGRPGSNRPPEAWKATALPNELLPLLLSIIKELFCGQSRVRTYVLVREQIYSLSPLTARPSALFNYPPLFWASRGIRTPDQLITNQLLWPTELHWQANTKNLIKHSYTGYFLRKAKVMEFV